jgi:MFS family permease
MRALELHNRPWVLLASAALIGALYALPQAIHYSRGGSDAFFLQVDEPWYAARLARVQQGWSVGNPWLYEHRDDPAVLPPPLTEMVLGGVGRLADLTTGQIVIVSRVVLPALSYLALVRLLLLCGVNGNIALLTSFWVFTEPLLIWYKPLGGLFFGAVGLPLNRFSNPLFPMLTFLLACYAGAKAFLEHRAFTSWAVAAGILLGLHFYISLYYWSQLILAFVVAAFLLKTPWRWRVLAIGAVTAAVVALPYVWMSLAARQFPVFEHLAWRHGLFVADRAWYMLPHKTLWIFIAAGVMLLRRRDDGPKMLAAFIVAGVLCYFSPLLTGVSLQNFHWHYSLAPFLFAALTDLVHRWTSPSVKLTRWTPALVSCFLLLSFASGVAANVRSYNWSVQNGLDDEAYREAWRWLSVHAEPDDVVLTGLSAMEFVPSRTGLRVLLSNHMHSDLVSFEEILERYQILWAMEGLDRASLEQRLKAPLKDLSVAQWVYGLPRILKEELETRGRPVFDKNLQTELTEKIAAYHAAFAPEQIAEIGGRYRLDYVVRGPNEAGWGDLADRWLIMTPVRVAGLGSVRIDRVSGWRASRAMTARSRVMP